MQKNEITQAIAQGATQWQARQLHDEIMNKIQKIRGWMSYEEDYDQYPVKLWHENVLTEDEILYILARGNSEEITEMIRHYGQLSKDRGYGPVFSPLVQATIARRNVRVEIDVHLEFQGFGHEGQDAFLEVASPEDILNMVSKHGLGPKQQLWLLENGTDEAICMHMRCHGLAYEVEAVVLEQLKAGNGRLYYMLIEQHELSVSGQILLTEVASPEAFLAYIKRYGLWNGAHTAMVKNRPVNELMTYIRLHRFLEPGAEKALAQKRQPELNLLYAEVHVKGQNPESHFLEALLLVKPLDMAALNVELQKVPTKICCPRERDREDYEIMSNGTHEQVMRRLKLGGTLCLQAFTSLFYRNNAQEFETYINNCEKYYFH